MIKQEYTFRVLVDTAEDEDVFRDIAIEADAPFEQLHMAIQDAFGFDNSQMASFYMADEHWDRNQEIALMDVSAGESQVPLMANTPINQFINDEQKRALYVFDFLLMWTFFVELVKTEPVNPYMAYPMLMVEVGEAPNQYSKEAEDLFGAMTAELDPNADPGLDEDDDDNLFDESNYY